MKVKRIVINKKRTLKKGNLLLIFGAALAIALLIIAICALHGEDDPVIDDPVIDDPVIDDPVIDDPVVDDPVIDDTEEGGESAPAGGQPQTDEPVHHPVVALTFDDGPSASVTPRLVEELNKRGIKATFFMLGTAAEANPDVVRLVHESGHQIASHTYDHGAYLTELTNEQLSFQINNTVKILRDITGSDPVYMRPPYGAMDKATASKIGWPMMLWTVDPRDWDSRDAQAVFDAVIGTVSDGSVVLFHDLYESTLEAVVMIVDQLITNGWRFMTLEQYYEHFGMEPQPGTVYRGTNISQLK